MLKALIVLALLAGVAHGQNCQNPGWGERCSSALETCVTSTSEGEGCAIAGDSCETCYRADLSLIAFKRANTEFTIGSLVYVRRGVRGWRITQLGRLATRKGIQPGDIITRIAGQTVTRKRLLAHFAKPQTGPYSIRVFKVRTGETVSLRIGG